MAGDWLKVEKTTPDKIEIAQIADALGMEDSDLAFAKVVRVWMWFDGHTVNGNAPSVTKTFLDRQAGCPGIAEAMQSVGWLEIHDGGVSLPNFDRHNGKTSKARALTAKRQDSHRTKSNAESNANSNAASVTSALPEKRREDLQDQDQDQEGGKPPDCDDQEDSGADCESVFASFDESVARSTTKFHAWHMDAARSRGAPKGMQPTEASFLRSLTAWEWSYATVKSTGNGDAVSLFRSTIGRGKWKGYGNEYKANAQVRLDSWKAKTNGNGSAAAAE